MRTFESGATRDDNEDKLDFRGFLSSQALKAFAVYMHSHRVQANGELRSSDNWKKGITLDAYMESMWRHFWETWDTYDEMPDGYDKAVAMRTVLCALLFNVQGMLHEVVKQVGNGEELLMTMAEFREGNNCEANQCVTDDDWLPEDDDEEEAKDYC